MKISGLVRKACKILGVPLVNYAHFDRDAIYYLANHLGDLHIEFMKGDGWWISCCTIEKWDATKGNNPNGESLTEALANAVIDLGEIK